MSNIIENDKGFKVIRMTKKDFFSIGGLSLCDGCNTVMEHGYYIAVLNSSYCQKDYEQWINRAERYEEDNAFELKKFNEMKHILDLIK